MNINIQIVISLIIVKTTLAYLPDPQNCCEYVTSEVKGASTVKTVYKFESQYLVQLVNMDDALHRGDERISYENGEWQIQEIYRNQYNRYKILFSSNTPGQPETNMVNITMTMDILILEYLV